MRYRVKEGGLKPSAIEQGVLGEFSRRARRVTSNLITRRGRLGTRLDPAFCLIRKLDAMSSAAAFKSFAVKQILCSKIWQNVSAIITKAENLGRFSIECRK